jgi:hypothetical protein
MMGDAVGATIELDLIVEDIFGASIKGDTAGHRDLHGHLRRAERRPASMKGGDVVARRDFLQIVPKAHWDHASMKGDAVKRRDRNGDSPGALCSHA